MISATLNDYNQLLSIKQKVTLANIAVVYHDALLEDGINLFRVAATVREFAVVLSLDLGAKPATFDADFPSALPVLNLGVS